MDGCDLNSERGLVIFRLVKRKIYEAVVFF